MIGCFLVYYFQLMKHLLTENLKIPTTNYFFLNQTFSSVLCCLSCLLERIRTYLNSSHKHINKTKNSVCVKLKKEQGWILQFCLRIIFELPCNTMFLCALSKNIKTCLSLPVLVVNRPGIARAVLQTPPLLIYSLIH